MFPEDLRDPESSTCDSDVSIPVETGRPLSLEHETLDVKRERSISFESSTAIHMLLFISDAHDTA
jgi:hypothetical protein